MTNRTPTLINQNSFTAPTLHQQVREAHGRKTVDTRWSWRPDPRST